jgi:(E)-4-hydroxy-3-methylbut-2-enyl-diphosphate synthase
LQSKQIFIPIILRIQILWPSPQSISFYIKEYLFYNTIWKRRNEIKDKMKKEIFIGQVGIGGKHPVSIQTMISTGIENVNTIVQQIDELKKEDCDIVRIAVPDRSSLNYLDKIIKSSSLPLIADIHFDSYLALRAIELGIHAIRINPGNIGSKVKLKEILFLANKKGIPIRIGVNSGSIEKKYWKTHLTKAEMMVKSVMDKVKYFEDNDFFNLKISLKSSDVRQTVEAYRRVDAICPYPLHLGITEAGTYFSGTIKSAIGIGGLLLDGIGDTIRVSLTDNPIEEVRVAKEILKVLGLRDKGIEIISCPTCSRTSVDLITIVKEAERKLRNLNLKKNITIAIMGCEVNGPGEAKDADIGLAFSRKNGFIFKKGEMIEKVNPKDSIDRLIDLVKNIN